MTKRTKEEFWADVERIKNSRGYRQRRYAQKAGALYTVVLLALSAAPLFIFEFIYGRSNLSYVLSAALILISVAAGFSWGQRKAAWKFRDEQDNKHGES